MNHWGNHVVATLQNSAFNKSLCFLSFEMLDENFFLKKKKHYVDVLHL